MNNDKLHTAPPIGNQSKFIRMKRWSALLVIIVIVVWMLFNTIHDFFANDTIQYFSTEPRRLLYVVAIGIIGGLLTWCFERLSSRSKRRVRIFSLGVAAVTLTAFAGYFTFCALSLASFIIESGGTVWVLFVPLFIFGFAAYFWLEFYRACKPNTVAST